LKHLRAAESDVRLVAFVVINYCIEARIVSVEGLAINKRIITEIVSELNISKVEVDFECEADQEEHCFTLKMKTLPLKCR